MQQTLSRSKLTSQHMIISCKTTFAHNVFWIGHCNGMWRTKLKSLFFQSIHGQGIQSSYQLSIFIIGLKNLSLTRCPSGPSKTRCLLILVELPSYRNSLCEQIYTNSSTDYCLLHLDGLLHVSLSILHTCLKDQL